MMASSSKINFLVENFRKLIHNIGEVPVGRCYWGH